MRFSILLSAMFLFRTTPLTYADLELSCQLIILILMNELKFIESLSSLELGLTLSTAFWTKPRILFPHFF